MLLVECVLLVVGVGGVGGGGVGMLVGMLVIGIVLVIEWFDVGVIGGCIGVFIVVVGVWGGGVVWVMIGVGKWEEVGVCSISCCFG